MTSGSRVTETSRPVRRRPSDRREIILAAANRLFTRRGYEQVTMAQIAADVGITAGALYRHFTSKADLLAEAIAAAVHESLPGVDDSSRLEEFLRHRAGLAAAVPNLDILWTMRTSVLTQKQRDTLLADMRKINARYQFHIGRARPDLDHFDLTLLGWVVQSVLYSTHPAIAGLPEDDHADLVVEISSELIRAEFPPRHADPASATGIDLLPSSRREALIVVAGRLFGTEGFFSTSLADIGAAAGTSGPTLYAHFESKDNLLSVILERVDHHLWHDLEEALTSSEDLTVALRRTVASYVGVVQTRPQLVSLLVARHQGAEETTHSQQDYIREWTRLLALARPELTKPTAKALVQATFRAINNLAWTSADVRNADFTERVTHIGMGILFVGSAANAADWDLRPVQ